ncbi:DUF421 domain-containing protein [Alkalihalobacillus sp. 1P02AB]|uniref:DUF421 domain-containing protein n=1 Tax=Alkalihalobacillus sp. 1P02AB TaxID=3132260 RepID=UPI0039A70BEE
MDIFIISLRTIIMFIAVFIFFRLSGKKDLGEISVLDIIVSLMVAELSASIIEKPELPLFKGLLPIALLTFIQVFLSKLQVSQQRVRDFIDGKPTIIIKKGRLVEDNMKKQGYNLDDILLQLREKDVADIQEVEYAILETSGTLSVFKKDATSMFTLPFIMDEVIQHAHLEIMEKNEKWLLNELQKQGFKNEKGIFYCSFSDGNLFVQPKDSHMHL